MSTSVGAVATIIGIVVGGFVGRRSQNQHNANWPPFNAALTSLRLVATPAVANAAGDLTDVIGRFVLLVADGGPKNRDDLQRIMAELASGQLAFVNAARSSLDGSQQPIDRQLGGPPPWREIEPYVPTPHAAD